MSKKELPPGNKQSSLGWEDVHRRMHAVELVLTGSKKKSRAERKNILQSRARELAKEPVVKADRQGQLEVLEFILSDEHYAVEARFVREVHYPREILPLPCTPPFIRGVINLRGEILPILDFRHFFNLPEKGTVERKKVVVIKLAGNETGLLADEVTGLATIQPDEILDSLPTLTGVRAKYLQGVTGGRLALLDVEKIMADSSIQVIEEIRV